MGVEELKATIQEQIKNTHVLVYCKTTCPFCHKIKSLFGAHCVDYTTIELDLKDNTDEWMEALNQITGQKTVPNIFINGRHIGGCDTTILMHSRGELAKLLVKGQQERDVPNPEVKYDYDVIVIGGGSGGLSCAKELGVLGAKVACVDYVKPTPVGTSWGLGGTCVNVGCIPKKLMHQASLLGESLDDARLYGWEFSEEKKHNWSTMVANIQAHIGSLNWGYRVALRDKNVKYINALATFTGPHTIKHVNKRGKEDTITAARFVISVGGRPRYPSIPGAREYGITSDDIFSLPSPPGKTLVVGASYVALECAGFMAGLGIDVTVMVRSILLRGFDQQMADLGGAWMEDHKVKFLRKCVPEKIELIEEGPPRRLKVTYKNTETGETATEEFNTVMFGIGRDADTKQLGLEAAGVKTNSAGKIPSVYEQTNVPHIYAIGDVMEHKHELTPLAIQAGKLLAGRLFGQKTHFTDYVNVPTTIFMPLEFGSIGLAEEKAIEIYGNQDIEVYHTYFTPLEFTVAKKGDNKCYAKLICNKKDEERVIGLHVLGPNAGEMTQGYGVAMRLGATKADFDATIGIHPTNSEQFTTMYITKASGVNVATQGC